ncbi:MBL fold metallo-hydrolase [candidate division WOR-3 bacterium]|nr:MBL fold metallo-hydrolase [candidate division WOR-3 bacterium]
MQLANIPTRPPGEEAHTITITILYDNYPFDDRLKTGWGFSCLIEGLEKTILFDTGGNGAILMDNMGKLMVEPYEIDAVFLSHEHWDHTGGLQDFLKHNYKAVVYLLASFPENIKSSITSAGAKFVEITSPTYFCERAGTVGELGTSINEQSLVIETNNGLVIVTGCAHPGIVHIIEAAKNYFGKNVYMVFGGFHLGGANDSALKAIIAQFRKLGVKNVGPCHCSGERCRELFKEEYIESFIEIGVGRVIIIE